MNPLTNVKNITRLNEIEEKLGVTVDKSWHQQYKDSAYVYVGGLPYDLSEGDVICVFSQFGEILDMNLVRDKKTGKSKGFCFICYEDQRSTILAVDNFNGIKLLGRTLRVDHVSEYRRPKDTGEEDEMTMKLRLEGVGPQSQLSVINPLDVHKTDVKLEPQDYSNIIKEGPAFYEKHHLPKAKHKSSKRVKHTSHHSPSPSSRPHIKKEKKDKKHKHKNKHKRRPSPN